MATIGKQARCAMYRPPNRIPRGRAASAARPLKRPASCKRTLAIQKQFCYHFCVAQDKSCFPQSFGKRRCADMEKYEKAEMEVVVFEAEDIITTSGEDGGDIDMSDW